ncbi:MAG TPA: DinB family protein [Ignavibacteria bacterium]|nr:DinB family protein [Ignavibacteria bacterium]
MINKKIITEFEQSTAELLQTLSSFTNEQFNKIPFEGSWTAGQVTEHLFKSESNAVKVMQGNTRQTNEREHDANEEAIRLSFLNFDIKFQSPDFILPTDGPKERSTLQRGFEGTRIKIRKAITDQDLSLTCTDFSFPGIGLLTKYEWICFVLCHSIRHTRQLKNIQSRLVRIHANQ